MITLADFSTRVDSALEAFRLEQQGRYLGDLEGDGQAALDAFTRGENHPAPADVIRYRDEVVGPLIAEGRTRRRVRIVNDPPTDHQRWADHLADLYRAVGEVIDVVPRSGLAGRDTLMISDLTGQVSLDGYDAVRHDFWLLKHDDRHEVLVLVFDEAGGLTGIVDGTDAAFESAKRIRDAFRPAIAQN